MFPFTCDKNKFKGPTVASSNILYTGSDLKFLPEPTDLPCNASLNEVLSLFDTAVTNIQTGINLTGLNKRCLVFDPATITVAGLEQVQIDKICALDASLTALTTLVNDLDIATMPIAIDLMCLTPAASPCLTPPNTYQLIAVLNVMISEICALKTAVGI